MLKILVIDDRRDNLTSIKNLIKTYQPGYKIITALSGVEGLKLAAREKPDTILLDISMPEMDGFEVCRQLKHDDQLKCIPIIFLTTVKTSSQDQIKGLELGADAYLSKPIHQDELIAHLRVTLRIKAAEDGLRAEKLSLEQKVVERTNELENTITSLKKSEGALRESKDKYKMFFTTLPNGWAFHEIILNDNNEPVDYVILEINDAFEKITGLRGEDVIGKKATEAIPGIENAEPDLISLYGKVALTGENTKTSFHFEPFGKWFSVAVSSPQKGFFITVFEDITEHKQAEEALLKNENRLRLVTDATNAGVWDWNIKTGKVFFSSHWKESLGYSEAEVPNNARFWKKVVHPDDMKELHIALQKHLDGETDHFEFEKRLLKKNGEYRLNLSKGKVVEWDTDGKPLRMVGVDMDITNRKHEAEKLKTLSAAIEQSPASVVITNPQGQIEYVNPKFCRLTQYSAKEVIGENPRVLQGGEVSKDTYEQLWETVLAGEEWRGEFHNKKKNGELYWENAIISPILNENREVTHILAVKEDITERRQIEADLSAQKDLLQKIVDQSEEGIVVIDPDFNFLLANNFAEKTLGIGTTNTRLEKLFDTYGLFEDDGITPLTLKKYPLVRALKGEAVRYFEMVIRNDELSDIKFVSVNAAPLKNEQEQIIGAVGTFHDITRNKRSEEILENAHLETEQLLASISSTLIGIDENDRISRWNEAAERTFELKAETLVGKPFPQCGIKWDWIEIFERIAECRDKDKPAHLHDIQFTRPDDRDGFLDITVSQILKEEGAHAGYLLLATEITERKNLESQLSNAQKLESIGQLAAGIAHEINTPIQYVGDNTHFLNQAFERVSKVLRKNSELLEATKGNSTDSSLVDEMESIIKDNKIEYILDEIPSAIQETLGGVEHVANIVRAMKEFSHPGNEEKTLTDINKALDSTITVSRNEWKYVAEMEKDFAPSIPLVPCLPGELNQVFLNLITNAAHAIADAAAKQGTEGLGKIRINSALNEDSVEIRISDTGTGIPLKIRKKIFDPFFTTKEVGKGTGQGLAISHNVIKEKHDGELTFETEIGKGTTFIIRLPLNSSQG